MVRIEFEWDETKNNLNRFKHLVGFDLAQLAFDDTHHVIVPDIDHSENEERFFCFGYIPDMGVMTVRFTYRDHKIRIIGAGFWRKGRNIYYERNSHLHG